MVPKINACFPFKTVEFIHELDELPYMDGFSCTVEESKRLIFLEQLCLRHHRTLRNESEIVVPLSNQELLHEVPTAGQSEGTYGKCATTAFKDTVNRKLKLKNLP